MPLQLKSTYVCIFTFIVTFTVYGWWTFNVLGVDYFTGPDALIKIGRAISIFIVAGYAFDMLMQFAVAVFSIKVLKNTKADFVLDERDKQILYKSLFNAHMVLCTGIFISVGALALGWSPFWVFNMLVLAFGLSMVIELITKLFLYKRGF